MSALPDQVALLHLSKCTPSNKDTNKKQSREIKQCVAKQDPEIVLL